MDDGVVASFDLSAIYRLQDIDVAKIARNNPKMLVEEYFILLSRFVEVAETAVAAVGRIANFEATIDDLNTLRHAKILMASVGHTRLAKPLDELITALQSNNKRLSSIYAQNISDEFESLYRRTLSTKRGTLQAFREKLKRDAAEEAVTARPKPAPEPKRRTAPAVYKGPVRQISIEDILKIESVVDRQPYLEMLMRQNDMPVKSDAVDTAPTLSDYYDKIEAGEIERKPRILAVDDAYVMIQTLSYALSGEYTLIGLTDPLQLGRTLTNTSPDMFLLDNLMPGRNGLDLIPIIRKNEEHKYTPVMVVTSEVTARFLSRAVALGVCDFMTKPVKPEVLREKIAKHITKLRVKP